MRVVLACSSVGTSRASRARVMAQAIMGEMGCFSGGRETRGFLSFELLEGLPQRGRSHQIVSILSVAWMVDADRQARSQLR